MAWTIAVGLLIASVLAFGWITGQLRIDLARVHTEIEIDASEEAVWAVMSDLPGYRAWNPLMVEVRGESRPGARMDWSSRLNGRVAQYNGRIDRAIRPRELTWTGPVSGLGRIMFWGQHSLTIEPLAPGRVRLVNAERFGGLATPFIAGFLQNDVRKAYDAANQALKHRVEGREESRATTDDGRN